MPPLQEVRVTEQRGRVTARIVRGAAAQERLGAGVIAAAEPDRGLRRERVEAIGPVRRRLVVRH
jgi:hypothetical protein